jgi:hypothetical protein
MGIRVDDRDVERLPRLANEGISILVPNLHDGRAQGAVVEGFQLRVLAGQTRHLRVDVRPDLAGRLGGPDALGDRLGELGERGEVDEPLQGIGLLARDHAVHERVPVDASSSSMSSMGTSWLAGCR